MPYLLVNDAGEILAEFEGLGELVRQPGLGKRLQRERGRLKVVRVDEHAGDLVSATSFVTSTPLPRFLRERSEE
jgi:hypothetical protein